MAPFFVGDFFACTIYRSIRTASPKFILKPDRAEAATYRSVLSAGKPLNSYMQYLPSD